MIDKSHWNVTIFKWQQHCWTAQTFLFKPLCSPWQIHGHFKTWQSKGCIRNLSSAVAGECFWKEKVPDLSPIPGQEASAGIIRRGTPCSFSLSMETSHSQSLQEVLEIHKTHRNTRKEPQKLQTQQRRVFQQEQKAKIHLGRGIPKALPHLQVGNWNFSTHPWEKGTPLGSPVFLKARWFYGFQKFAALTAQLLICE